MQAGYPRSLANSRVNSGYKKVTIISISRAKQPSYSWVENSIAKLFKVQDI